MISYHYVISHARCSLWILSFALFVFVCVCPMFLICVSIETASTRHVTNCGCGFGRPAGQPAARSVRRPRRAVRRLPGAFQNKRERRNGSVSHSHVRSGDFYLCLHSNNLCRLHSSLSGHRVWKRTEVSPPSF